VLLRFTVCGNKDSGELIDFVHICQDYQTSAEALLLREANCMPLHAGLLAQRM
jgi:hypothetical protein